MSGNTGQEQDDYITFGDLVKKGKSLVRYVKSKWLTVAIVAVLGGALGVAYSYYKKPIYTASSTFVLGGESKGGGLSQYAGLASLAGIDISTSGGGNIFQEDNIIELYKSRLMIEKTLLSSVNTDGFSGLLIDRYISFNKLREKWKKNDQIDTISFNGDPAKFNRKQDSIITTITGIFNKSVLSVAKLDKKLSIIKVDVSTGDELFSKEFNLKLVENVNNFYTQTKTKKALQNVVILQRQADSVKRVLNSSLSGVASAIDAAPNANPAMSSLRVPSQRRQIDVQASSAIYGEVVKNLEVSKMSLRQETPLIQLIDQPVLPLTVTKIGHLKGFVIGLFLGAVLAVIFISSKRIIAGIRS